MPGLDAGRDLVGTIAWQLAENMPEASELRAVISNTTNSQPAEPGGILDALPRPPLVGADLDPFHAWEEGRKIAL